MSFCLVLLAAGDSKRFGDKIPKPYMKIAGKTLLEYSLIKFRRVQQIKKIVLVTNKKHKKFLKNKIFQGITKITGGKTRAESAYKALKYIKKNKLSTNTKEVLDAIME